MDWEVFYNHFREPDFIPGYEIQNRLGGGAFGEVYKARKASIGKAYAIKFLKIDDDAQREAVERELEQVRHFAAIDHPNLVTIEDLGTVSGVPYLIMGYAGEDTLARALKSGRLEPQAAFLYFVQACRGVLALHDRRLVHFDLKPSNIFLKGDIARVGDYGLSKMMTDGRLTLSFGRGTPQYMAPEMLKNRADHRADLYSLGVILYESLSGKLPFESGVPGTISVREDDRPPAFPDEFPAAMRRAVERCLRLDPEDRYPTVGALLEDLGQAARPGDSVRLESGRNATPAVESRGTRGSTPRVDAKTPRESPIPAGERPTTRTEARQAAAELTRGAVEVARGVWDGLKNIRSSPRTPSGTRPPSDARPPGVRPPEPRLPDARPADLRPADTRPSEARPADARPSESPAPEDRPADARALEPRPPEIRPASDDARRSLDARAVADTPVSPSAWPSESAFEERALRVDESAIESALARSDSAPTPLPTRLAPSAARDESSKSDAVVMFSLAEGMSRSPTTPALAVPPIIGSVVAPAILETIPVPPAGRGGWLGTLRSSLALAVEVLVSLLRGLARRVSGESARNAAHTVGAGVWRIVRLVLFILFLAILGGLVTWVVILLVKGSP
jgi:serine/threonine protein kinase